MFTLVSSVPFPASSPNFTLALALLTYARLYIYTHIYHLYIWLSESARRRNEIVPKTAGKLCNREEPGPRVHPVLQAAQHSEALTSEAGSCFFSLSLEQQLAWWGGPPAEGVFSGNLNFPCWRRKEEWLLVGETDGKEANTRGQWGKARSKAREI